MRALLVPVALLGLLAVAISGDAAEVTARVDRESIQLDESFRLIIQIEGDIDGTPDFAPLDADFEIRNRSESQNIQIIHGQFSRLHQWTLTLIPRRAGRLVIPPIAVGSARSTALRVDVSERENVGDGDASGPIFLEAEVTPAAAYVQSQVIYRLRLYRSVDTRIGRLDEPSLSEGEALIERLGEDRGFETRRNGKRYTVVERRYLVSPQRSGRLVLAPLAAEAIVVDPFAAGGRYERVRAPEISVDVQPVPPEWGGAPWLPARNVTLSESWSEDPAAMTAGDPVSYEMTVEADGMVAELLPAPARDVPHGLKQYPDRPNLENRDLGESVTGRRVDRAVLIPGVAGSFTLPPVRLEWWNTVEHRKEVAEIPSRAIQVQPAPNERAETGVPAAVATEVSDAGVWPAVSGVLAVGWLLTLAFWLGSRRRSALDSKPTRRPLSNARTMRAITDACRRGDGPAASRALLAWGGGRWPDRPPRSLGSLGARCRGRLAIAIKVLEQHLYGRGSGQWDGSDLMAALNELPEAEPHGEGGIGALLPLSPPGAGYLGAKLPPNV